MEYMKNILKKTWPALVLAFATFFVFSFSISYPILNGFDDNAIITDNVSLLNLTPADLRYWALHSCNGSYLPLVMYSYMLDHAIWGLHPFGYHLQNIIWHLLAVYGFYACARHFGIRKRFAIPIALIFAVHPQRVESVVWLSERKDVICAAFYFWSVFSYLKSETHGKWWYVACFSFFACALLSKSMAVTLPIVLILLEFHKTRSINPLIYIRKFSLFLLLSWFFVRLTTRIHSIAGGQTNSARQFFIVLHNIIWYVGSTLLPLNLNPIYPMLTITKSLIIVTICVYVTIIIIAVILCKRNRNLFVYTILPLAGCYLFSLLPVAGVYHVGYIDFADRFSYIPSAFLLFGLAAYLNASLDSSRIHVLESSIGTDFRKSRLRRQAPVLLSLVFVLFSWRAILYSRNWKDIHSVFAAAAEPEVPNHVALGILGDIEMDSGSFEKALKAADRLENLHENWMVEKILEDNRNKANYLRGAIFAKCGKDDVAISYFEKIKPFHFSIPQHIHLDYERMLATMSKCYFNTGNKKQAVVCLKELIGFLKNTDKRIFYKGVLALFQERYADAVRHFSEILKRNPENKQAAFLLARAKSFQKEK